MKTHTVIAGAGISGIRAALDLAELGHKVVLVDKAASTGGILSKLDHQFPDNHCGMCTLLPMIDRDKGPQFCLRKGLFHDNVTFVPSAEITSVKGPAGQLSVVVEKQHTGIDASVCIGCRACEEACPVSVADTFNESYCTRKAVYLPVPHQVPNRRIIDFAACTRCGECVNVCPVSAISLEGEATQTTYEKVNAVILATGTGQYDPSESDLYGFGVLPNVVTSTGLERIMNSSGPYEGAFCRPSDKKPVKRMAWLQCVGSRNLVENADHCSSACCMFAVKEAVMACEKAGKDLSATILYMDMRTFGRDFQRYKDEAENKHNLNFVRCRIHSIEPHEDTDDLKIGFVNPKGKYESIIVDMAVLATGKNHHLSHPGYAGQDGVFALSDTFDFKDIAESLITADVAAAKSLALTGPAPAEPVKVYDPALMSKAPKVLTVICGCGNRLSDDPDLSLIVQSVKAMAGNPAVLELTQACGQEGFAAIQKAIKDNRANRVLIMACNPFVFDVKIKTIANDINLPAWCFKALDVRSRPKDDQALSLLTQIKGEIHRLKRAMPSSTGKRPVTANALVIGGGPSGLSAAHHLATAGVHVDLIEKTGELGGNGRYFSDSPEKIRFDKLLSSVQNNPGISVHLESSVVGHEGRSGAFTARISSPSGITDIAHGAAIMATGGMKGETDAYQASRHDSIISVFDLEDRLNQSILDPAALDSVVMIQCAGTREEPRNYCSRICCVKALKNAIRLKTAHPAMKIVVFYRDMMTYGESEKIYTEARKKGVLFVPFDKEQKPAVAVDGGALTVTAYDPVVQEDLTLNPGLLVLSTGLVPNAIGNLAQTIGLSTTFDGFLKEMNSKWRPVDSGREGIFLCGLGRAPLRGEEAMDEGIAAAMRSLRILAKPYLPVAQVTARVRHSLCTHCEACIPECPYQARYKDRETGKIMVDAAACQGCGACASVCPNSSILMGSYEEQGIMDSIESFLLN